MTLKGSAVSSKLLILELQCQRHQSRSHTSMFTMFRSSNDRVVLTIYPAEVAELKLRNVRD